MRLASYLMLLFSIELVLFFMGYGVSVKDFTSKANILIKITCPSDDPFCQKTTKEQQQNIIIGAIILWILAAGAFIALITGYSALFFIPVLLLMAILNFFFFPLDFLYGAPDLIKLPVIGFFNVITVLACMNFIRGGI